MTVLAVGAKAPNFELKATGGEMVSLSELLSAHKYLVMVFYPAAWSPVCGDEMALFQEFLDEFERHGAGAVGISVDNIWSIEAWAESKGISFPLLSDFQPKGAVAANYGVMRDDGLSERALFIVDAAGVVRYSYVSPLTENPGVDGVLEALESISEDG